MSADSDRIELLVSEKRVKLHLFEPSKRKIWTIVGKGEEYWLDPDSCFCSCPGFYLVLLMEKLLAIIWIQFNLLKMKIELNK